VSGPTTLPDPLGAETHRVRNAREMHEKCMCFFDQADVVIGAAAVADYRPLDCSDKKIKKNEGDMVLQLTRNPDILAFMGQNKGNRILVGFAAETHDLLLNGQEKVTKKNLDLIVANDVTAEGAGFAGDTNIVTLIDRKGTVKSLPQMSKQEVARIILDAIVEIN
jgi:phosphopantothenoylcysteine decarboxylase/phosphopantothenate--cysteine ligase